MVEKLQLPIAIEMDIKSKCVHIKDITVYQASNDTDTIRCTAVSYRRSQFTILFVLHLICHSIRISLQFNLFIDFKWLKMVLPVPV